MSFKNEDKIMDFLKNNKGQEFKVTEIAERTGIDLKNMSKYTNHLKEQGRIKIRPQQDGKVRTKFISWTEPQESEQLHLTPPPKPQSSLPKTVAPILEEGSISSPADESKPEVKQSKVKPKQREAGKLDLSRFERILKCKSYAEDKNLFWEKKHLLAFFEGFLQQYDPSITISF